MCLLMLLLWRATPLCRSPALIIIARRPQEIAFRPRTVRSLTTNQHSLTQRRAVVALIFLCHFQPKGLILPICILMLILSLSPWPNPFPIWGLVKSIAFNARVAQNGFLPLSQLIFERKAHQVITLSTPFGRMSSKNSIYITFLNYLSSMLPPAKTIGWDKKYDTGEKIKKNKDTNFPSQTKKEK